MKQYPKYKSSNIDWIGDIPEHWDVKRLKYVATASPSNIDKKSKEDEDSIFLCNYVDVYKNDFITDEIEFMKATASKAQIEKFTLRKGDIIATKDSESANDIGIAALVKQDFENVVCGYHLTYIKPEKLVGEYLFRQFQSEYIKRKFETLANGVTRYALGVDAFNCLNLVLPPESEQIAIANYLDKKTQEIDQLIEDKKQLIQLLEEEKTTIISQFITKGLDPNAEMINSEIEWIGEIPKHWEVKKLKYVATINDETLPETTDENYEIEYIEISNVKSGIGILETSKYTFKNAPSRARRIVKDGDIIVSTVRTYLKSIAKIYKPNDNLIASTGFAVVRPRSINNDFIGYLFYSERLIGEIISKSTGVSYPAINASQIGDIYIPIPEKAEQEAIVKRIEMEFKHLDTKIEKNKKLIDLLIEYRSALISEVVTGKVKVID